MNFNFKEKRNDTGHQRRIYMKFPSGLMALCFLLIWCRLGIHLPARQSLIWENEILTPAKDQMNLRCYLKKYHCGIPIWMPERWTDIFKRLN